MKSKFIKLLIASVAVLLVLWLLDEPVKEPNAHEQAKSRPSVSVVAVKPKAEQTTISVTGLVKSRWQVELTANVRGQVTNSFEQVLPGSFVKKGQVIAQINEIEYAAALASAKANVTSAKLELARILNEQSVAKQLENGAGGNDYRLHKPHVEAAKASLQAAQANVQAALKQFNDTKVKAPFDAIVLAKHIVPSQQVNMGDSVYTLASSDALDVEVSLSSQQWQKVAVNEQTQALIEDTFSQKWQAKARYLEPVLNSQTRQRSLLLAVDSPFKQQLSLLPEQQVKVIFSSKLIDNAVVTPATVLTRDNKVWTVTDNKLSLEQVSLIDESADTVMFQFVEKPQAQRQVVLYPLSTMLAGQSVEVRL